VGLKTNCIKNVKFKIVKIRTGCQYRILLPQRKPKLGRTKPLTGPRDGHSCTRKYLMHTNSWVSTCSRQSKSVIHIIIQTNFEEEAHHAQFRFAQTILFYTWKIVVCLALQSDISFAVFHTCAKVALIQPFNTMPELHITLHVVRFANCF